MQGFNMGRYYPPSADSPPSFNTSHPLGARARKLPQGILTVRFEMPFAVWCEHCKPENIIGQGVRFNAEKKKMGMYHSTPIWSFRMKHTICSGWIEIRTDPQAGRYVVTEGARRRDGREEEDFGGRIFGDEVGEGEGRMLTEEERERRRTDAFAALEGKVSEKGVEKRSKERIEELLEAQEKSWRDPDEVNRRLRRGFRAERKELEKKAAHKEGMQDKFGIGFEIVDEVEGDRIRAGLIEFGDIGVDAENAIRKPLFASEGARIGASGRKMGAKGDRKTQVARDAENRRQLLQQELRGNTRAALDPFLANSSRSSSNDTAIKVIAGIKRKRMSETLESNHHNQTYGITTPNPIIATSTKARPDVSKPPPVLVAYDSD